MIEAVIKVHVVMGNDFPDAVYADESDAKKFCNEQMAEQSMALKLRFEKSIIYWRVYSFDLIKKS